jgi:hypothetical protein
MSGACAAGCPYGLVNDPYPGQCSQYIDANGDGICDLSQIATSTQQTTQTDQTSSQNSADNHTNASTISDPNSGGIDGSSQIGDSSNFHILPITLILLGSYFFTYFLFKKGILKPKQHKRLWNLLVTFGYVGTGITGVLLTLLINMGISTVYNQGISYFHAELAILMVVGTLIHLHIYRKPFKKMFKVLFGFKLGNKGKSNKKNKNVFEAGTSK